MVLSLVRLQAFDDSPRPVWVSRHRLFLSSPLARLQTSDWLCFVWSHETVWDGQWERHGKQNMRRGRRERRRRRLNRLFVHLYVKKNNMIAFDPPHASWIHSLGISYVCFKTNWLPSYALLPVLPDSRLSPPPSLCTLPQWLIPLNKTRHNQNELLHGCLNTWGVFFNGQQRERASWRSLLWVMIHVLCVTPPLPIW